MDSSELLRVIFAGYEPLFSLLPEEIPLIGSLIPLPSFSLAIVQGLLTEVQQSISQLPPLVEVPAPCYIIGDIHGNIHDLVRIFVSISEPLTHRFVFLGDYVDRGDYSIDVCILLFTLFLLHPGQFHLLRGNHEFACVNEQYGFKAEVIERYGDPAIWQSMDEMVFQFMPLAALVAGHSLCLHAGIGPGITSLDAIRAIALPLPSYEGDENVTAIVWADPRDEFPLFGPSARGIGGAFGQQAVDNFLTANHLKYLIRGHQCVQHGVSFFGEKCVTVFSSGDYANSLNSAAFLLMEESGEFKQFVLPPIEHVMKDDARYSTIELKKRRTLKEQAFGRGLGMLSAHASWKGLIPTRQRKRSDPSPFRGLRDREAAAAVPEEGLPHLTKVVSNSLSCIATA